MDYSAPAIILAKSVSTSKGFPFIQYFAGDLFDDDYLISNGWGHKFDIVLDKGTFDAISLSPDNNINLESSLSSSSLSNSASTKTPISLYPIILKKIMNPNGNLLITSCNWVEKELIEKFGINYSFFSIILSSLH